MAHNRLVQALSSIYMVDFFVDDPINTYVPTSWTHFFNTISPSAIIELCDPRKYPETPTPYPLGICALRTLSRIAHSDTFVQSPAQLAKLLGLAYETSDSFNLRFDNKEFYRKVKLKKRHEIERIVYLVKLAKAKSNFGCVVDIGAGLGHLTRALSLTLPEVAIHAIEADEKLVRTARKIDAKFASLKQQWDIPERRAEVVSLEADTVLPNQEAGVCLVGVHACGDLSSTIIRMFEKHKNVKALILFGCCYHKLNGGKDKPHMQKWSNVEMAAGSLRGYPLSPESSPDMSFAARELACYARKKYISSAHFDVKQQLYRAMLEKLVVLTSYSATPPRHLPFRGYTANPDLTFLAYVNRVLEPYPEIKQPILSWCENPENLANIERIVDVSVRPFLSVVSLRILIAPLLEAAIVDDRTSFLRSFGFEVYSFPLFDSSISPRNLAIVAFK